MISVFLTGHSGFVGQNFCNTFLNQFIIHKYDKNSNLQISSDIVLHCAGKSHDLNNNIEIKDYYEVNYEFTKKVFDSFLVSNARVFIFLSSVKAVADNVVNPLTESQCANPLTHFGKSKLLAEQYILLEKIPESKRVYILRPCMIHGPGNKGNFNLLYKFISNGVPWPLGAFENKRSFCSIDNLLFIIKELIDRNDIPSGIYNVADDINLSTIEVIGIIAQSQGRVPKIWKVSKSFIQLLAKIGDVVRLPLNSERLYKLTETYIVSNHKIKTALAKTLPVSSKDGLLKTFKSFK
jgi:nucleoside-diphosphate-sugar epimerase